MKEKLKKDDKKPYSLINREIKKFEIFIKISSGISLYGISQLIFLDRTITMHNFDYW